MEDRDRDRDRRPSEDRRPGGESFDAILRRFSREVQQSGLLSDIKKRRFREKDISRTKMRQIAQRKAARKRVKRGY